MKKMFLMAVAALTLSLASCTQKSDDAAAVIETLKSQLASGNAEEVKSTLQGVQAKVAELVAKDPETAKEYVVKVQEFVKENSDKIKSVIGDNAIANTLVETLTSASSEDIVNTLTSGQSAIGTVQEAVENIQENASETAQEAVNNAAEAVADKASEVKENAKQAVADKANEVKQQAAEKVNNAAEKVNEKVSEKVNEGADKLLKGAGLK